MGQCCIALCGRGDKINQTITPTAVKTAATASSQTDFPDEPTPIRDDSIKIEVNADSLKRISDEIDFQKIINTEIKLDFVFKETTNQRNLVKRHERHSSDDKPVWEEKYYAHGDSTEMLTHVTREIHGDINSPRLNDFDDYSENLHGIYQQAEIILRERYNDISIAEKKAIEQVMVEQRKIIKKLLEKGRKRAHHYESDNQKLIEDFVKKVKLQMIDKLDQLDKEVKENDKLVLETAEQCVRKVNEKAQEAKEKFHNLLHNAVRTKVDKYLADKHLLLENRKQNSISFQRYGTLNFRFYASTGDTDVKVEDVADLVEELDKTKSTSTLKRVAYVCSDDRQL